MAEALEKSATMVTATSAFQGVLLEHVSWRTYESLLKDFADRRWPRFTYDEGSLEIMTPSHEHDAIGWRLQKLVETVVEEWELDLANLGHGTMRRKDMARGFEADASIYLRHAEAIRGKKEVDLEVDPPPDLVIEVEATRSALPKLPLYANFGVPEVWRWCEGRIIFHVLQGSSYAESSTSLAFPSITSQLATELVESAENQKAMVWVRSVRKWARENRPRSPMH